MKLKSLLLGSAAALALSTGAQAADPIASFVSLDVCDAYGISGLTISSDDTCLRISGEVEYEFAYVVQGDDYDRISEVDWNLQFEATTQTDFGMARAVIRLTEGDGDNRDDFVGYDRAFVSFGDTTVITAGLAGSIFGRRGNNHILSEVPHARVSGSSHVIQVAHDLGNGWDIAGGFENLNDDDDGLVGARVSYSDGAFGGRLGAVVRNLFEVIENDADADWRVYGDLSANLGAVDLYAEFITGEDVLDAILTAAFDADFVAVRAGVGVTYDYDLEEAFLRAGAGLTFALTDTVDLDIEVIYQDEVGIIDDYYLTQFAEEDMIYGTAILTAALAEGLTGEAWASVGTNVDGVDVTEYAGGLGLGYTPGGNFELGTGVGFLGNDIVDDMEFAVHFNASKSF